MKKAIITAVSLIVLMVAGFGIYTAEAKSGPHCIPTPDFPCPGK